MNKLTVEQCLKQHSWEQCAHNPLIKLIKIFCAQHIR